MVIIEPTTGDTPLVKSLAIKNQFTHGRRSPAQSLCGIKLDEEADGSDFNCAVCKIAQELTRAHGVIDAIDLIRDVVLTCEEADVSALALAARMMGPGSSPQRALDEALRRESRGERVRFFSEATTAGILVVGEHVVAALLAESEAAAA
jgi:hypothetical protein